MTNPVPVVMFRHLCFCVRSEMGSYRNPKPGYTFIARMALEDAVKQLQKASLKRSNPALTASRDSLLLEAQELLDAPTAYGTTLTQVQPIEPVKPWSPPRWVDMGDRLISWERYMSE